VITGMVRRGLGAALLSPDLTGMRQAVDRLRQGGAVAIFVDETLKGRIRGPFFGHPHDRGNLRYAVQLARMSGALLVPGYVLRTRGCRFVVRCLPAIELPPEESPGARRMQDIQMLNDLIEPIVLENLDQWYFLHDRLGAPPKGAAGAATTPTGTRG
jgi:KDO2-lipid IV(A) lauroyltransferase